MGASMRFRRRRRRPCSHRLLRSCADADPLVASGQGACTPATASATSRCAAVASSSSAADPSFRRLETAARSDAAARNAQSHRRRLRGPPVRRAHDDHVVRVSVHPGQRVTRARPLVATRGCPNSHTTCSAKLRGSAAWGVSGSTCVACREGYVPGARQTELVCHARPPNITRRIVEEQRCISRDSKPSPQKPSAEELCSKQNRNPTAGRPHAKMCDSPR